ncbi:MAG: hypothetical protein JOZ99_07145, partial [Actinobacteria bacterium]|nr:hypothetical protein [Actinomycetota bacterium]
MTRHVGRVRDEQGFAIATVMLAMLALTVLSLSAVGFAVGSQNISKRDENWHASLAAAEAGLDDFVFRLNQNSSYYLSIPTYPAATAWTAVPGGATNA